MKRTHVTDMTTGSPIRHILLFTLPLLFGNIFQQLYNMVDAIVVGRYVGANALAAVGSCGSMNFLFFSLAMGLATGIGVMISQFFGAKDYENIYRTIANSIYVVSTVAIIISIIGILTAKPLLILLKTPVQILPDAVIYLRTTCAGMIAISAYNAIAQMLRALGDSRTPLVFLVISSFINIGLDLAFVIICDMGVLGVALATIIAQVISALCCLVYAYRKIPYFRITKEHMNIEPSIIKEAFYLGVPLAIQSSMIAVSCVVLQGIVNTFGAGVVAAYTITGRIEQLVHQPYGSLGTALTTYTGQNIGAGKKDRVKKGFVQSTIVAASFSLIALLVMWFGGKGICSIFVNDSAVIDMGAMALKMTSLCYLALGMIYIPRAVLNGCSDAGFAMINGISEVICRIGYSKLFTSIPRIGYMGIWITTAATWVTTAIVCLIRYKYIMYPSSYQPELSSHGHFHALHR